MTTMTTITTMTTMAMTIITMTTKTTITTMTTMTTITTMTMTSMATITTIYRQIKELYITTGRTRITMQMMTTTMSSIAEVNLPLLRRRHNHNLISTPISPGMISMAGTAHQMIITRTMATMAQRIRITTRMMITIAEGTYNPSQISPGMISMVEIAHSMIITIIMATMAKKARITKKMMITITNWKYNNSCNSCHKNSRNNNRNNSPIQISPGMNSLVGTANQMIITRQMATMADKASITKKMMITIAEGTYITTQISPGMTSTVGTPVTTHMKMTKTMIIMTITQNTVPLMLKMLTHTTGLTHTRMLMTTTKVMNTTILMMLTKLLALLALTTTATDITITVILDNTTTYILMKPTTTLTTIQTTMHIKTLAKAPESRIIIRPLLRTITTIIQKTTTHPHLSAIQSATVDVQVPTHVTVPSAFSTHISMTITIAFVRPTGPAMTVQYIEEHATTFAMAVRVLDQVNVAIASLMPHLTQMLRVYATKTGVELTVQTGQDLAMISAPMINVTDLPQQTARFVSNTPRGTNIATVFVIHTGLARIVLSMWDHATNVAWVAQDPGQRSVATVLLIQFFLLTECVNAYQTGEVPKATVLNTPVNAIQDAMVVASEPEVVTVAIVPRTPHGTNTVTVFVT